MHTMREAAKSPSKGAYSEYSIPKNIEFVIHVDLKTTFKRPFSSIHHRIQLIRLKVVKLQFAIKI